jgi:hypothetical protein
LAEIKTN